MEPSEFTLVTIGTIHCSETGFALEILPPYRGALQGLKGYSHINVFWWCHYFDAPEQRKIMGCEKPYVKGPDRVGIFATRSPIRPNPLALTAVAVIGIDEQQGLIRLAYIDAEDGTPVVDIKPYLPCSDRVLNVQIPAWCQHWPQSVEESANFDWQSEFENTR